MSLFFKKYRRLSGLDVCREIEKFFEKYDNEEYHFSDEQKRVLRYYWGDNIGNYGDLGLPFQAYSWKPEKTKTKPIMRLTMPFFFIWMLITLLIIRPVHWLFTGNWYFHPDHWFENSGRKWTAELFGE